MRRWTRVGAALAIAALAAVAVPAAQGWDRMAPIPVDEFGGSSIPNGYVFGGYSFSTGQQGAKSSRRGRM